MTTNLWFSSSSPSIGITDVDLCIWYVESFYKDTKMFPNMLKNEIRAKGDYWLPFRAEGRQNECGVLW
jgi:hypothetical protein